MHPLQHLTDNDLDMFVIDFHTLKPINLLNFIDQKLGKFLDTQGPTEYH